MEEQKLIYNQYTNVGRIEPTKYKSHMIIGNLIIDVTKSFTEKQKANWLENFGVEIVDIEEETQ